MGARKMIVLAWFSIGPSATGGSNPETSGYRIGLVQSTADTREIT
jgi:hypothetical protein